MKDFASNELEVGQRVITLNIGRHSTIITWATVIEFTPKKVQVEIQRGWGIEQTVREPGRVIVPMNPELQDFIQAENLRANLTS